MKSILKRWLALFLVVIMLIPNLPVLAKELPQQSGDSLSYNLGDNETVMLSPEDESLSWENWTEGKDTYILELEADAFFPYEVQFSYNGKTFTEWFMTPDDIVEVGDYKFGVHSEVTGTKVTQLKLDVNGKEVVVYPEKKKFTKSPKTMLSIASLLPLEEKSLSVDLSGFTPVELTRVSISSIFAGKSELDSNDNVSWKRLGSDESYEFATVSGNEVMNANNSYSWEMIVGTKDQLDMSNTRYIVTATNNSTSDWLSASVYTQDENGNRTNRGVNSCSYSSNYQWVELNDISWDELYAASKIYVSFQLNTKYSSKNIKVFEGKFDNAEDAAKAKDITSQVFCNNMSGKDAGYLYDAKTNNHWITFVSYEGEVVTGVLPVRLFVNAASIEICIEGIYKKNENSNSYTKVNSGSSHTQDGYIAFLNNGYSANQNYLAKLCYLVNGVDKYSSVKAVYKGKFASLTEAAGGQNIKDQLLNSSYGYADNYCEGVDFTFFIASGEEGKTNVLHTNLKVEETKENNNNNAYVDVTSLYSGTAVTFTGLKDVAGKSIDSYCVEREIDSYGSYNFKTILVDSNVDLSKIAPVFTTSTGVHLYAEGSSVPEESGKTYHDFSKGILQYRAAAENGSDAANYWLQIVKKEQGSGNLYINSLKDEESKTETKDGVIYSTREVLIDEFHNNKHDILLANIGTDDIGKLGVTLESDVVKLDPYWTLTGNNKLLGFSTLKKDSGKKYGKLPNLAKLRLTMKDSVDKGTDVTGKLTIVSGNTPLVVLNLTGTIGNPKITTNEIPQAVKYVPYGSMILNNNKYDWNKVTYEMVSGKLPEGVTLKENGELYGVPKEYGTFEFTVRMKNSYSYFSSDKKTFTMTVLDNTDANVDAATDEGYKVIEKIGDVTDTDGADSYLFVSEGVFDEFEKVFLDGEQLGSDDFSAVSGSTRITIKAQTLKKLDSGSHTIGVEFRTGKNKLQVKRAAQNVKVKKSSNTTNSGGTVYPKPPVNSENTGNNDNKGDTGNTGNSGNSGNTGTNDSSESNKTNLKEVLKTSKAQKKVVKLGNTYLLDKKGKTIKNSFVVTPKGNIVYTNKKGIMVKGRGFTAKNGKKYYAQKNGIIAVNGFFETELGNTVYATKTGALKANKVFSVKGKQYVAKKSGALVKNRWFTVGKKKYFCDKKGVVKKIK